MSDLLFLAKDFIERMANPAYGIGANEEYALQFASLLQREGFEQRFLQEILEATDRGALSSYGWLWLLDWAKSRNVELSTNLLVELFDEWSDVFAKTNIMDLATRNVVDRRPYNLDTSIGNFPHDFLSRVMLSAVRVEREEERKILSGAPETLERPEPVPALGRSEAVLVCLLQVGRPITLDAASLFLRHRWVGLRHMHIFFWLLYDRLDEESQAAWRTSIPQMPARPNQ